MVKRQSAVIYLDTNTIFFYIKENKNTLQFDLPSDVISDLEVVNRQKLDELTDAFFQKESVKGIEFDAVLVFSQATTFEKDFTENTAKTQFEDIQKFLDLVPFEDVLNNVYKINKKTKVVAVNKALYDSLYEAFERNKVYIFLVLPATLLVETNEEFAKNLDFGFIANKEDSLKQFSLVDLSGNGEGNKKNSIGIKKKDIRLYVLLGIFVFLFIILAVLIYTTFFTSKPKPNALSLPKTSVTKTLENGNNVSTPSGSVSTASSSLVSTPSSKTQ